MSFLYRLLIGLGLILAPLSMVIPAKPWGLACALTALLTILAVAILEVLGVPGSEDDEDKARAKRFARENGINEEYVSIPTGRRAPRIEGPPSRYDRTVMR